MSESTGSFIGKGCMIAMGIALAIPVFTCGGCFLLGIIANHNKPPTAAATPMAPATPSADHEDNMRRIVTEDRSWDDSVRGSMFQSVLRTSGNRCDAITSMVMRKPGSWVVACKPAGYTYAFTFDKNGKLTGATRL